MSLLSSSISGPAAVRIPGTTFAPRTIPELLRWRAATQPARPACTYLAADDEESPGGTLTYAELDARVRAMAGHLQEQGATRRRALLVFPPGLDNLVAFHACLYAGVVAVPAHPPRAARNLQRLAAIAADARADFALTTGSILARVTAGAGASFGGLRFLAADAVPAGAADAWSEVDAGPDDLAYLQYTSGSTASPKGVMVSHANVFHNSAYIHHGFGHTPDSLSLSWLPHFHDMGLIDGILQPLFGGFHGMLMSPAAFLQQPLGWLEAVSRLGVTHTGGPNFAYELCARRAAAGVPKLDLSRWRVAYNGAEPVRAETLERFAAVFASSGFRREAFYPAYGLAEATLKVTGGLADTPPVVVHVDTAALERNRVAAVPPEHRGARALVGSGHVALGTRVEIVNPDTLRRCGPGEVGEVWVASPSVAGGYWERPEETERTFGASLADTGEGPFLRTGDLGFVGDGELFITGRLKDLIIVRGRNLYPQDLELSAERSHAALRPGCGAAFSVEEGGEERLVLVYEVDAHAPADPAQVAGALRRRLGEEHDVSVHALALIRKGTLPKTSSGKIQRRACRAMFLECGLELVGEWREAEPGAAPAARAPATVEGVRAWLSERVAGRLGVSPVEVDPDAPLAALGLDSLGATELVHAVETQFGAAMSLVALLDGATLGDIAMQLAGGRAAAAPALVGAGATTTGDFPLSSGQEALWFLHRLAPESAAYIVARALRIAAPVDVDALRGAWQRLADRHAALRTTFPIVDGAPVQRVARAVEVRFRHADARGWDGERLGREMDEVAYAPFDLETRPLLRVALFTRADDDHVLVFALHHVVTDFWSLAVLLDELGTVYGALRRGREPELPPLPASYAEHVERERAWLGGPAAEAQAGFWDRALAGVTALDLPADRPRPRVKRFRGAAHPFALDAEVSRRLGTLAREEGATPYALYLAAFQLLLHRYTGQTDLAVGTATAGRASARFAGVAGYFVNPVVLRGEVDPRAGFRELVRGARRTALDAFARQDFPFAALVQRLHPERDPARSPLFDVMFNWQQGHASRGGAGLARLAFGETGARAALGPLPVESVPLAQRVAQFDLTLNLVEGEGGVVAGVLEYDTDLFEAATVSRMADHFVRLLAEAAGAPERPAAELPLLDAEERRRVVEELNATRRAYPAATLHGLVEAQARRTPGATAVVFEGERVSYAELDARAERLAACLAARGVGPETRVGVCLERSVELVVALLAVLKAGGAYVPLDPGYPRERLAFMARDSGAAVLVTTEALEALLPDTGAHRVRVDADAERIAAADPGVPSRSRVSGLPHSPLAYVIYTSGSTGTPKAAMNTHAGIVNRLLWMQEAYGLGPDDVVLQKTPFSFDVSVWELFWPLLAGARLVVARPGGHQDPAYLAALMESERVTTVHFVPSMLQRFLDEPAASASPWLRRVVCSGEALPVALQERFFARMGAELHNLYGPTEAAVDVTAWRCEPGSGRATVPIGRPVANTRVYVLDAALEPLPPGVPGELYLGGVQLARGYLGRPDLTAERFLPDPFAGEPGGRLYRTGDRARVGADGAVEYLGRLDDQIKLRGFRIEPGEIEAALREHPAVGAAAVVVRGDGGDRRLVAYVAGSGGNAPAAGALRRYLRGRLPEHMVPGAIVPLEVLPLTPSGKLDRRALPVPAAARGGGERVPPGTPAERAVAGIWSELLGVEEVGAEDDFFDLGGHSLLATRVASRLRESLGVELPLHALFEARTVASLAALVDRAVRAGTEEWELAEELERVEELSDDEIRRLLSEV